ncbi:hypothetical protein SeMB42_g00814 [Synchytrium endobioticum]|uniref:serine C-palmitoyltransferase n=1 Tax=Synchytrium endobioticum TaxID=286115 RepID=A0A507DJG9_9FUNG|nr:hypothetical protein SeLEV6574_g00022 [Synchytrium endobioticum]TPX53398.1 hypothetical protein SeMB42_g00814 [Synchytrium endobioticum]
MPPLSIAPNQQNQQPSIPSSALSTQKLRSLLSSPSRPSPPQLSKPDVLIRPSTPEALVYIDTSDTPPPYSPRREGLPASSLDQPALDIQPNSSPPSLLGSPSPNTNSTLGLGLLHVPKTGRWKRTSTQQVLLEKFAAGTGNTAIPPTTPATSPSRRPRASSLPSLFWPSKLSKKAVPLPAVVTSSDYLPPPAAVMGKGAHLDNSKYTLLSVPLSSADVLVSTGLAPSLYSPPPLYKPDPSQPPHKVPEQELEQAPTWALVTTYMSYFVLIVYGHIRDFFGVRFRAAAYKPLRTQNGYAPINSGFDTFYHRRLYVRIRDCFNRPITNVPGRTLTLLERESPDHNKTFNLTGHTRELLNLSSYNYLGFAQSQGPCANAVEVAVQRWGISVNSSRAEVGTLDLHHEVEHLVARFVGQEAALLLSMGFATNSTTLPALVSRGCLIISDELNHSSLVYGSRISGASIKVFKHNDPKSLETVLRESIAQGQPRTHRPWKKILVVVEGLYSMEGTICRLPEIIDLKRKYGFYLYLDEAHSIGAVGPNGRGICDYYGVDPTEVDILMGTFTKSFGAAGGYISGSRAVINHIKLICHSAIYAESISVPVLEQICTSMKIIMGEDGTDDGRRRIQSLASNAQYFSTELKKLGFIVYGDTASPVIPLMLFHPAKIPAFSREMLERGIAVVVVGYPATSIIASRVRFCVSAAHTREDIDNVLKAVADVGDRLMLRVNRNKAMKASSQSAEDKRSI